MQRGPLLQGGARLWGGLWLQAGPCFQGGAWLQGGPQLWEGGGGVPGCRGVSCWRGVPGSVRVHGCRGVSSCRGGLQLQEGPRFQGGARLRGESPVLGGRWGGSPGAGRAPWLQGGGKALGGPRLQGGAGCRRVPSCRGGLPRGHSWGGSPPRWGGAGGSPAAELGGDWAGGWGWDGCSSTLCGGPTPQSHAKRGVKTPPGWAGGCPQPLGCPPAPWAMPKAVGGRAWSPWARRWGQKPCCFLGTEAPAHPRRGGPQSPKKTPPVLCRVLLDILEGQGRDVFSRRMVTWKPGQGCYGAGSGTGDPGDTQRSHRPLGWEGGDGGREVRGVTRSKQKGENPKRA